MNQLAKYLWAAPNTLVGIGLGVLSGADPRIEQGVVIYESEDGIPAWLMRKTKTAALCMGHSIVSRVPIEGRVLRHEMIHVRQYEKLGPAYWPYYLYLSARHGWINPLEREAYEGQDDWTGASKKGRVDP